MAREFSRLTVPVRRLLLAMSLGACASTQYVPLSAVENKAQIIAVDTKDGARVDLARPGVEIHADTLYAVGPKGQLRIPTDSIREIVVREPDSGATIALVMSLTFSALMVLGFSMAGSSSGSGGVGGPK